MSRVRRFLEDLGGLSFFAAKSERGFFFLAIAGGIAIFPFSFYNFAQGRPLVGWFTGALAIWFLVNGVAVARGRRLMPAALVFLPTLGVLAYAMVVRGDLGVFWGYPAILLFHFILPRWTANLYNISLILITVSLAARWLTPEAVTRVAVTMVLTLVFTNIFSYLTERQRRREEAEEREVSLERDRLGLLVHATKAGFTDWDANSNEVVYSERFKEMLGYTPDADTSGWPNFFERMHPEDRERVQGEFRAMLRQKRDPGLQQPGQALDYRLRRADGSYVWVHAESLAQVDEKSLRISRFITSYQDISKFRAQEQLMREQHKFIGDVLDSLPIGLTMRDLDGKYVFVNRAWETFTGSRREEVVGKTVHERAPKEEADRVVEGDREMFARGPDAPPALQDMHHNGRRYILSRTVMTGADGRPRGVLVASVDTTERYVMEQALASEQKRLELVVRAGSIGFLDWDGAAKTAYYSRRFKEILGYAPDADTSSWPDYFEMIHAEDRQRVQERFRRHIFEEAEEHETMQYRLKKADGSHVWVEAVGLSVRDAKGFATRFIASIRDISERRAEEEARLTEQRRLDLVVSAARVGIVDWDGRTHATFYSPRFREMLGYAADADTSGWPDYFRGLIHPEDRERVTKRWRAFILGRGPEGQHGTFYAPEQYRLKRADGGDVWIQASGVAVRDEKGFVLRWIAAVTDITEQRVHEEALRETVRLREEVERMTRHDLKTPLNSIIAVPKLIREGRSLSSDEHQLLSIVERAGYRILNLVNLSLDLFRMEQGRYTFRPQAVDLADLVAKVIADLESQAASKSVAIVVERKAEAIVARAEELLCYSMVANLLKNAIEASPEGGTVTVTLQSGLGALVHVHNAGAVPEVVRERFFDKYSTAGKPEGLGLGTYSALLMARVQEGHITMRTSEEEGTTLTIQLAEAPPDAAASPGSTSSARGRARIPALAPLDVLVVDDDEFNRLVMRRYLPSPPLNKVAMAVNGRAAIEALRRQRYDYVFLDLEMPVMSGYEAAGRIRALERDEGRKPTVLVAFSSNDDETSIRRALAAGCDHYLTKPAPRETLWKILAGSAPQKKKSAGAAAGPTDAVKIDADLRPTLPAFFLSRRETLDDVAALLGKGDRAGARRLAHKLAGSFSLYGFKWAADQCRQVERAAASADPAELLQRVLSVRAHLDSAQLDFVESAQA